VQDYEGAVTDFDRAIRFWAGDKYQKSNAYYWRGLTKIDLSQKDSGRLDLRKSADLGYAEAYEALKKYCQ
jgi:hypothetical protein